MLRITVIFIAIISIASCEHFFVENEWVPQHTHTAIAFGVGTPQTVERFNIGVFQFLFVSQRVSWYEADVICGTYNATLATTVDKSVTRKLRAIAEKKAIILKEAWVGGRKFGYNWEWINDKPVKALSADHKVSGSECLGLQHRETGCTLTNFKCTSRKSFLCQKDLMAALQDQEIARPSPKIIYKNREFVLYPTPLSFPAAAAFCAFRGLRLAVLDDKNLAKRIARVMVINRPTIERIWTSGRYFDNVWRWLPTNEPIRNIDTTKLRAVRVVKQRRSKYANKCLFLEKSSSKNPKYLITSCDKPLSVLCENAPSIQFTPRMGSIQKKKTLVSRSRCWYHANADCKAAGGYLAQVQDSKTLQEIIKLLQQNSIATGVWLGGKIATGKPKPYFSWENGKTVESVDKSLSLCQCSVTKDSCLAMIYDPDTKKSTLQGLPCDYMQPFICDNVTGAF